MDRNAGRGSQIETAVKVAGRAPDRDRFLIESGTSVRLSQDPRAKRPEQVLGGNTAGITGPAGPCMRAADAHQGKADQRNEQRPEAHAFVAACAACMIWRRANPAAFDPAREA